jgi:hypothetical protein
MSSSNDATSISERLNILYGQYKNITTVSPTDKQIELISKLDIGAIPKTTVNEAQKQIRFLLGNQKITEKQQTLIRSFPKEKVDAILRKDVIIQDITRFEMTRIMNVLSTRHNLKPKVYNHPLISTSTYEYGWQESDKSPEGKMYYIVFYDLLMVDIDNCKTIDIDALSSQLISMNLSGHLYRTYNGFHVFITSRPINHKTAEAKYIMSVLACDIYYVTFAYLNGFKVRLNPKLREDEMIAAEYIGKIGTRPEDPELVKLLELHDKYIVQHKKLSPLNDNSPGITKVC